MRGRKQGEHNVSRQTEILIKKESPNEGTETPALAGHIHRRYWHKKRIPE